MKEMKVKKRLLALLVTAVAAMAMTAFAAPAFADYTPVNGPTVTLNKYMVVNDHMTETPDSNPVFTVSAGNAASAATGAEVKAGLNPAAVKLRYNDAEINGTYTSGSGVKRFTVAFESKDAVVGAVGDNIIVTEGQKYATYPLELDFSGVTFATPGIYRYYFKETGTGLPSIAVRPGHDTLTIDVYVVNDETAEGTLKIQQSVAYIGQIAAQPSADGETAAGPKGNSLINDVSAVDLKISKQVAGSLGNQNDTFEFQVTITGLTANLDLVPYVGDADTGKSKITLTGSMRTNTNGTITFTQNFKHNEQLVFVNLPASANATYTVQEADKKGYEVTGEVSEKPLKGVQNVTITNTKEASVPTGVLTYALPGIVLIALAALVLLRKRGGATK